MKHERGDNRSYSSPANQVRHSELEQGTPLVGSRQYDAWALPLIAASPKVLEVIAGGTPDPEVVEIFLTNYYDFHCPHCRFRQQHGGPDQYLALATLERLLDELAQRNVRRLELSGGGEPLVHPDIAVLLTLIARRSFHIGLITNGYAFVEHPELIALAARCADWIRLSVDGFTEKSYRKVHGNPKIRYTKLREVIARLTALLEPAPRVGIKILISKLNAQDALLAIEEALALGAHYLQFKFLGTPRRLQLTDAQLTALTEALEPQIAATDSNRLTVEWLPPYRGVNTPGKCLMTFLHPVIDWDGQIYVCAFFEHRKRQQLNRQYPRRRVFHPLGFSTTPGGIRVHRSAHLRAELSDEALQPRHRIYPVVWLPLRLHLGPMPRVDHPNARGTGGMK